VIAEPHAGRWKQGALNDATGHPIPDLTSWLGMPGHAIVFSEVLRTFQHLHGHLMGGGHGGHGATAAGGAIGFETTFPRKGRYKVFFQVKRASRVLTASYAVRVE
jgi:hypothetical protein